MTAGPPPLPPNWRERLQALDKAVRNPTRIDLDMLAGKLGNNPATRPVAQVLRALAKGDAFAEPGERENAIWKACSAMHRAWPHATLESIVALWQASAEAVEAIADVDIPVLEQVETKWLRLTEDQESYEASSEDVLRQRRGNAWALAGVEADHAIDIGELPVAVTQGKTIYVRVGDRWVGPWMRDDLTSARVDLGALYGQVWTEHADMVGHIIRAAAIEQSLVARENHYDPVTRVLTVAVAPIRADLEPAYSDAVNYMLEALGGQYADQLKHWCAGVTRADHPCRALVLSGIKGFGKTLFINGVGRLWPKGPARMRDVIGKRFNGATLVSRLAIADDDITPAETGDALVTYLREAVSDRTQRVERKYHEVAMIEGCMRYVVGTNDADALVAGAISWRMNDASLDAFGDRLLHIPVPVSAASWWTRCGASAEELIDGDLIARHVLWLAQQPEHETGRERFWVGPGDEELARHAVMASGLRGDVLLRVHEGLQEQASVNKGWLVEEADRVLVNPGGLLKAWFDGRPNRANNRTVGEACRALAERSRCEQPPRTKHKGPRWVAIDLEMVEWFAERCCV